MTPIALCADDYGQHAGIDTGILHLLAMQRLTAVSCMSNSPRWHTHSAPALREGAFNADIGCHLNLTEGFSHAPPYQLSTLLLHSYLTRMNHVLLRDALHQQLDQFETGLGRTPDFIDGHQHIHQFPHIRDALLHVLTTRYPNQTLWIRNTLPAYPHWGRKSQALKYLGGTSLARMLRQQSIPTNHGFAGVYGFDQPDYAHCFKNWLTHATESMLIMCHPANTVADHDPIAPQRVIEYQFFNSSFFTEQLNRYQIKLIRLSSQFFQTDLSHLSNDSR